LNVKDSTPAASVENVGASVCCGSFAGLGVPRERTVGRQAARLAPENRIRPLQLAIPAAMLAIVSTPAIAKRLMCSNLVLHRNVYRRTT
jgi:hypothetical protein